MTEETLGGQVDKMMAVIAESEAVIRSGGEIHTEQASKGRVCDRDTGGEPGSWSGPCPGVCPGLLVSSSGALSEAQRHSAAVRDVSPNAAKENRGTTAEPRGFQPGSVIGQQGSDGKPVWDAADDEEIARRAREEGRVDVVFPGSVTQDGCCRFVCELLKFVLYQRQQLPMTYDQMVFFQKQQLAATQQEEGAVGWKSIKPPGDSTWQRCQRTLRELDEVLHHLEVLFSLSHVPRVLFMLGSSGILPTELYEINMEALVQGGSDMSLRTSPCLRRLFRTLFVADLLSDVKPVRLVGTTVVALAHRDCGVEWFKPKVDFRVPTRVKRQVISLASDAPGSGQTKTDTRDRDDFIWFQTPVAVKGFCK